MLANCYPVFRPQWFDVTPDQSAPRSRIRPLHASILAPSTRPASLATPGRIGDRARLPLGHVAGAPPAESLELPTRIANNQCRRAGN